MQGEPGNVSSLDTQVKWAALLFVRSLDSAQKLYTVSHAEFVCA